MVGNNIITCNGYKAVIGYEETDNSENGFFFGQIIGINDDIVCFEANDAGSLRLAFSDALNDYLQFAKENRYSSL